MAKAAVNEHGLLAPGEHAMTLAELEEMFGRFQRTDRRATLFERLCRFVKDVRLASERIAIYVDGSFIMARIDEPDDIDVALILPGDWDSAAELNPYQYNVVSRRMVRKLHGFDILVGFDGQTSATVTLDFFRQVNVKWLEPLKIPAGTTKGLVRVEP